MDKKTELPENTLNIASTWARFFNFLIDMGLYYLVSYLVLIPLAYAVCNDSQPASFWLSLLLGYSYLFLYYLVLETLFQKTLGKLITGTKVIMLDGSKPDVRTVALRSLIRLIPWEAISIYTGKEPDKKGTWWHDRWTSTRVIKNK